jgi:hypothetical protein
MSVEISIEAEVQFNEVSVRDQVVACFKAAATDEAFLSKEFVAGLSSQFENTFNFGIALEEDDTEYCTVSSKGESALLLSVSGRVGFALLKEFVVLFKDEVEEAFLLECIEFSYEFYTYSPAKGWLNCSRSAKDQYEVLLGDFDVDSQEKLSKLVSAYKNGEVVENGVLSNKDFFDKIADASIDPYDDGYIFEIEDSGIRDENGETLITAAVKSGNVEVVFHLVQNLDPRLIATANEKGETPLALAQAGSNERMLKWVEKFSGSFAN